MNWVLIVVLSLFVFLLYFFWRFEKATISAKEIALIATLTTLAAVLRVPFALLPGLQLTTFLVMLTGYVFGGQIGFMVGALTALLSNFFLGQGPWTLWQMFAWGLCGSLASLLPQKGKSFPTKKFAFLTVFCAYLFGAIMNLWHWLGFVYPLNMRTWLATYLLSLPFDTVHACGNFVFSFLFGEVVYTILKRFQRKFKLVFLP